MLSESEASVRWALLSMGLRCFALAQHDMSWLIQ